MIQANNILLLYEFSFAPDDNGFYGRIGEGVKGFDFELAQRNSLEEQIERSDLILADVSGGSFQLGFGLHTARRENIPAIHFALNGELKDSGKRQYFIDTGYEIDNRAEGDESGDGLLRNILERVLSYHTQMSDFESRVFTAGQAAKILRVAPKTVCNRFDSGQLRGYKIPGSQDRRILYSSLADYASEIPLVKKNLRREFFEVYDPKLKESF